MVQQVKMLGISLMTQIPGTHSRLPQVVLGPPQHSETREYHTASAQILGTPRKRGELTTPSVLGPPYVRHTYGGTTQQPRLTQH